MTMTSLLRRTRMVALVSIVSGSTYDLAHASPLPCPPETDTHFLSGQDYYNQQEYEDAAKEFDKALGYCPNDPITIQWAVLASLELPDRKSQALEMLLRLRLLPLDATTATPAEVQAFRDWARKELDKWPSIIATVDDDHSSRARILVRSAMVPNPTPIVLEPGERRWLLPGRYKVTGEYGSGRPSIESNEITLVHKTILKDGESNVTPLAFTFGTDQNDLNAISRRYPALYVDVKGAGQDEVSIVALQQFEKPTSAVPLSLPLHPGQPLSLMPGLWKVSASRARGPSPAPQIVRLAEGVQPEPLIFAFEPLWRPRPFELGVGLTGIALIVAGGITWGVSISEAPNVQQYAARYNTLRADDPRRAQFRDAAFSAWTWATVERGVGTTFLGVGAAMVGGSLLSTLGIFEATTSGRRTATTLQFTGTAFSLTSTF